MARQFWRGHGLTALTRRTTYSGHLSNRADYSVVSNVVIESGMQVDKETIKRLEEYIANSEHKKALSYYERLSVLPNKTLSQKLAILLAKRGNALHIQRSLEILRSLLRKEEFRPDDYTKLAIIYVVDGCLRHKKLNEALEIYDEAYNLNIILDLQAYDGLLQALIQKDKLGDAVELLKEISAEKEVIPTERSYMPLIKALLNQRDYTTTMEIIEYGRTRNVEFSFDMYQEILEIIEEQDEDGECYERFVTYLDQVISQDNVMDQLSDDEQEDDDVDSDDDLI